LYLAKLFGADGIKLGLQLLTDEDVSYQLKIAKAISVTPILVVHSLHQLRRAVGFLASHNALISIDDRDLYSLTISPKKHRAMQWLKDEQRVDGLAKAQERPLIFVEGRIIGEGEEQEELRKLGVVGSFVGPLGGAEDATVGVTPFSASIQKL